MGSLIQDVIGLFSKKKYAPVPYDVNTDGKEDFLILSKKLDSSLNVMAYNPKLEQELISIKNLSNALGSGITLQTNNTSGASTLINGVLNIPNYTGNGVNAVSVATAASTGAPLSAVILNKELTLTSGVFAGGNNVGYVPDGGTNTSFLRGDGTWSSTGTVTSVDLSTDIAAFVVAANPITSTGTITLNLNGGTAGQFLRQDGTWATPTGGGGGTVTSVSGTGTVSGLTLTGTVTSSGDLTLGGTLALTLANVTTGLGFTPYNATNPAGYTTFAEPGIFSGGGTPTLATGVTALEVRTLIGAGISNLTLGTTLTTALAGSTTTISGAQATAINDSVKNDTDTYTSTPPVTKIITLTQAEYTAITTPNVNTLYIII